MTFAHRGWRLALALGVLVTAGVSATVLASPLDVSIIDKLKEPDPKIAAPRTVSALHYVLPLVRTDLKMADEAHQDFVRLLARSSESISCSRGLVPASRSPMFGSGILSPFPPAGAARRPACSI